MYYDVRSVNIQLFRSYLTNRRRYLECNGTESMLHITLVMVLLFLNYINDLLNLKRDAHFTLNANETNVLMPVHNIVHDVNHV